ncbi:MAG: beta-galactosidase, partial [Nevskiaceae bacterium]
SYFRWRQAPFAQEQMHAGLLRPDRHDDVAADEVREVAADVTTLGDIGAPASRVALVFDYLAQWVTETQPQGAGFTALRRTFEWYSALRQLGLDVDVVPSTADLTPYALILIPCLPIIDEAFVKRLSAVTVPVLMGPRTGSKTAQFQIPPALPPGLLQAVLPLRVTRVESLREGLMEAGEGFNLRFWFEHIETELPAEWRLHDGRGVLYRHRSLRYLAGVLDESSLRKLISIVATEAGLSVKLLPDGLRLRRLGDMQFAFNYSAHAVSIRGVLPEQATCIVGGVELKPAGVAVWRERAG